MPSPIDNKPSPTSSFDVQTTLRQAVQAHQASDFANAIQRYEQILTADPNHAKAHQLLGLAYFQTGNLAQALTCVRKAVALNPNCAEFLASLGTILRAGNDTAAAVSVFQKSLQIDSSQAGVWFNLGNAFVDAGMPKEATQCFLQASQLQPELADVWRNLGNAYRTQQRHSDARDAYQRALAIRPEWIDVLEALGQNAYQISAFEESRSYFEQVVSQAPELTNSWIQLGLAHHHLENYSQAIDCFQRATDDAKFAAQAHDCLGNAWAKTGDLEAATKNYERALELQPSRASTWNNLGNLFLKQSYLASAIACYRCAIDSQPSFANAIFNYGHALTEFGEWDRAIEQFRQAIQFDDNNIDYRLNYANTLFDMGELTRAREAYQEIIKRDPNHARCRYNQSLLLLHSGELKQGFQEYENRLQLPGVNRLQVDPTKNWQGEFLPNSVLLLDCEQGLGDTIQFVRYARWARDRVGKLILRCQDSLVPLLKNVDGIDACVAESTPVPSFDYYLSLLSLPAKHGTELHTIPAQTPYLFPGQNRTYALQSQLSSIKEFKVGISWQGNPEFKKDRYRSIPLAMFSSLAKVEGCQLIKLQKGYGADQATSLINKNLLLDIDSDVSGANRDVVETARLIQQMDLVITSDSFIAHLAGALNVPTWIALGCVPEWRWMNQGESSPWYPSVKLFRQTKRGEWQAVFEEMTQTLKEQVTQPQSQHVTNEPFPPPPKFHLSNTPTLTKKTIKLNELS